MNNIFGACRDGNVNALLSAIKRGEDVNKAGNSLAPLMHASNTSSTGHLQCMIILINSGADVNGRDSDLNTALQHAASVDNVVGINLLLDNGAKIDSVNNINMTPLMVTCYDNYTNSARVLLERGANLTFPNEEGNTCLHIATMNTNIDMIKLFFQYGADDAVENVCNFNLYM